jgi:hypothetical protein
VIISWPRLIFAAVVVVTAACGKRGNPQAPIRPVPGPVTSLAARRIDDQVQLRFAVPTDSLDRTVPLELTRVEVYAAPGPPSLTPPVSMAIPPVPLTIQASTGAPAVIASAPIALTRFPPVQLFVPPGLPKPRTKEAPPTTPAAITKSKYLRKKIDVQPPPSADGESERPTDPNDARPKPGDTITVDDSVSAERAAASASPSSSVLRYVVVGVARGKRLGAPSPVLEVPLSTEVPPPGDPQISYDETSIKLTWTSTAAGQTFRVYRAGGGKEDAAPLNATPLTAGAFATPVEFGVERCFVVRAALVRGPVSVESAPAAPACVTAVDTFPPPAPNGLSLLPTEDHNQLTWNPVSAGDLAGYLVLRSEEGTAARVLTDSVIPDTNYTDRTVKSGAHYTYTVVAVDKAGNRSAPSNPAEDIR